MTDHSTDNPTPEDEQDEQQSQQELSLEDHLQGILDQIEDAEPGLLEADQLIGDDGKPRFVPKPKPKPKPEPAAPKLVEEVPAQAETAQSAEPAQPAASSHEPIEEDELAALINQAIDQASTDAPKSDTPTPAQMPQASDEELSRAVDRDIDQAVEQAAQAKPVAEKPKQKVKVRQREEFNPANNFVPIEPDELGEAIEEAFAHPIPHNENAPAKPEPVAPDQASAAEQPQVEKPAPIEVRKRESFDPASNFVPIEPDELGDAIEEAFAHPIPHNENAPTPAEPVAEEPEPQTPVEPAQAVAPVAETPEAPQPTDPASADPLAGVADDAKMSNDDLDALFDAIGEVADTSDTKAPQPADTQPQEQAAEPSPAQEAPAADPLAGIADDAKMSNDDLDALFDSVETVTGEGSSQDQPTPQQAAPATPAPPEQEQAKSLEHIDDFEKLSNDDLDALFADPDSLLAEQSAQETSATQAQDDSAFSEDDFSSAWDTVLTQAQDELAKIAEDKIARHKERAARKLDKLREKAKHDPKLTELLEDTEKSVFDDQDFAQQWDQVLTQARTQLGQMVGKPEASTGNGGKLSNEDLTAQLDNLLAEVQAESDTTETFESLDENQLSSALDNVLSQAKTELARLTDEKLKRHQESHAQKIQTIRESLSADELATELDDLINHALEAHEASEDAESTQTDEFEEDDFASAWENVLGQAKDELSRLAIEKKQRQEARAQAVQKAQAAQTPPPAAPPSTSEDASPADGSVDLASELDALFADTAKTPDKPVEEQPAAQEPQAASSQTLDNDQLANELENLMSQAMEGAVAPEASAPTEADESEAKPAAENITADEIQALVDSGTSEPQAPETAAAETTADAPEQHAIGEPQDPSAMINHIDSLLAEHASEAVSDMFETPEKIAEHGLSEDDLEAAFQSPDQVLQNLQEASQNTSQAKQDAEAETEPQASVPPADQAQAAQTPADPEASDDDLEGYFETPDDLDDQPNAAQEVAQAATAPMEEAVEVSSDEADELMGDFESPDEAVPAEASPSEEAPVEMAYEADDAFQAPDEIESPQTAAVQADAVDVAEAIEDEEQVAEPKEKKPSIITRLIAQLNKLAGTLAVLLAKVLKQLGPYLNKLCAMVNSPLLRLNKSTRDLVGYIGLVQLFLGVILFFVFFKKMLFGD